MESKIEEQKGGIQNEKMHPIKVFFWKGVTIFLVVASCLLFGCFLLRFQQIMDIIGEIMGILQPIIYGLVISYLLNPIMKFWEVRVSDLLSKKIKNQKKVKNISRSIAILFSLMVAVIVIIILAYLIIPELIVSLSGVPEQIEKCIEWAKGFSNTEYKLSAFAQQMVTQASEYVENWIRTDLLKQLNIMAMHLTGSVVGVFNIFYNILIGVIISIYVLGNKEVFEGQSKKILYAVCSPNHANEVIKTMRRSHKIFSGFISGKLLDSLIIGVLCFLVLSVLKMPYTLLVSVIVGVTNVIPFFGPYIGAIPSTILILLVSPKQGIVFLIFIILLQQLDGNIIGPKILGESTGLSAFWVVFSILLGGGLFGIVGMLIGVPTFAVIYSIIKDLIERQLKKRKLPLDSVEYHKIDKIECHQEIIYKKEAVEEGRIKKMVDKRKHKKDEKQ